MKIDIKNRRHCNRMGDDMQRTIRDLPEYIDIHEEGREAFRAAKSLATNPHCAPHSIMVASAVWEAGWRYECQLNEIAKKELAAIILASGEADS